MLSNDRSIAVLMATYNGETYLASQLDSLLGQSLRDFTCYIHDDGSSDGTLEILREYEEKYPDVFVIVPGPGTGGARENFLFLMRTVESDYYMFCDQDDVWLENKIERTFAELKKYDERIPQCVYTDLRVVDAGLSTICGSFFEKSHLDPHLNATKDLLMTNVCVGCTMIINRYLRDLCIKGNYKAIIMHDWAAVLIASCFGGLHLLNEATMLYRQHGTNEIGVNNELSLPAKLVRAVDVRAFLQRKKFYRERQSLMAAEILQVEGLPKAAEEFLGEAAGIYKRSKIQRMRFYRRHDMFRQRNNKLWQLLWL